GNLVFFRVGDSSAPTVTITSPSNGASLTSGHISVLGNTTSPVNSVWVNRRQAQLNGSSFTATDVLLILGTNTLYAAAVTGDGNIFVATSSVTRLRGNQPPDITITSPADTDEIYDVTPLLQVSYSDDDVLDYANKFHAYLD